MHTDLETRFAKLIEFFRALQYNFDQVDVVLRSSSAVGERSPLYQEWRIIRREFRDVQAKSRTDAENCATFLSKERDSICSLAGDTTVSKEEKTQILKLYLEDLKSHERTIADNVTQFHETFSLIAAFSEKLRIHLYGEGIGTTTVNRSLSIKRCRTISTHLRRIGQVPYGLFGEQETL